MIDTPSSEVERLVQEGRAAALAGDSFAARASFRRAAELAPECVAAWVGLSGVAPVLAEKRDYLQRALALDPGCAEAQASLRYVEKLQAEGLRLAPAKTRAEPLPSADPTPASSAATQPAVMHCYKHPDRETGLRCVHCERPICGQCSRAAPVGQICPACRRVRRPQQYKVSTSNLIGAGLVALIVSALAAIPLQLIFNDGFVGFYLMFLIGPLTGELIVRITDRVTRAKRGRSMQITVGGAMVLGMLPFALLGRFLFFYLAANPLPDEVAELPTTGALLLSQVNGLMLVFLAIAVVTVVARLK